MNKDEQFLIRLTVEEKAKLKEMAYQENTTMAKLIKSRVFGLKSESIHKDFKKELVDINKKLFSLLGSVVKGNENQDQIIELLSLMTSGENAEPAENKNTVFDRLIDIVNKYYIDEYKKELDGMNPLFPEYDQYNFAKKEFQKFTKTLEDLKEKAYPNA